MHEIKAIVDPEGTRPDGIILLALMRSGRTYEEAVELASRLAKRFKSAGDLLEWLSERDDRTASLELSTRRILVTEGDVRAIREELSNPGAEVLVEQKITAEIKNFIVKTVNMIRSLNADSILREGVINPFLVKALNLRTFDDVAKYFVYQTVARSIVTSFGYTLEEIGRILIRGVKPKRRLWWDAIAEVSGKKYYVAIKSGPHTMNADIAREFVRRAKSVEHGIRPAYVCFYGKELWPIAKEVLKKGGLEPIKEYVYVGKRFYEHFVGDPNYYLRLLSLIEESVASALTRTPLLGIERASIMELIESKVAEVAKELEERFKSVDELIQSLF
ncbi:MAG: PmeII family type II restriction endonuclease [Thermosphaera sp.]